MLTKAIQVAQRNLTTPIVYFQYIINLSELQRREFGTNPGILSRIFNTVDANTTAYQIAKFDPTLPLKVSFL